MQLSRLDRDRSQFLLLAIDKRFQSGIAKTPISACDSFPGVHTLAFGNVHGSGFAGHSFLAEIQVGLTQCISSKDVY